MSKDTTGDDSDRIVFPSEKIGVEEQFLPATGGSYLENHEIRAAVPGKVFIDTKHYRAKVFAFNKGSVYPSRHDTVIAHVIRVTRSTVRLSIGYVNKKSMNPTVSAIMHISDASTDYIEDLDDYYAAGDVIRAKVIDAKTYPIQLEAKSNNHGVIATTCKFCGEKVEKIRKNQLKCLECGREQSRATSIDFGSTNFIPEY